MQENRSTDVRRMIREADDFTFTRVKFHCIICNNEFNCTNKSFDPYLPIHHTTFMALRFVLRPFTLRMPIARRSYRSKILIVFDFVLQKSGQTLITL